VHRRCEDACNDGAEARQIYREFIGIFHIRRVHFCNRFVSSRNRQDAPGVFKNALYIFAGYPRGSVRFSIAWSIPSMLQPSAQS
jgi:hypothetical protein